MVATDRRKTKHTGYHQVLEAASRLSQADQRRLREELLKLSSVRLEQPISTEEAIREGRRLAEEVRVELAKAPEDGLDEVMRQMRGRAW